ncbi:MAG: diguanylate cyclase [Lysobacteraceae bacterium]
MPASTDPIEMTLLPGLAKAGDARLFVRLPATSFNQRLMQQVLANTPILINVKDLDGRFLYASMRMAEIVGIGVDALRGMHARDVLPVESLQAMTEHEQIVRDTQRPSTYRDTANYAGVAHEFLTVKFPILSEAGILEAIGTISTDTTDLVEVKAELHEVQERFHQAFDNSAIGMALVSLDGRWLQVNRALCELLGYSEAELLRLDFQALTHEDDIERDVTQFDRLTEADITSYSIEKRYLARDGRAIWTLLSVSAVRDADNGIRYFINQIQDISERKRIEAQLTRSNADLSQAVADLQRYENKLLRIHELSQQLVRSVDHAQAWQAISENLGQLLLQRPWFAAVAEPDHHNRWRIIGASDARWLESRIEATSCLAVDQCEMRVHLPGADQAGCRHVGAGNVVAFAVQRDLAARDAAGYACIPLLVDGNAGGLLWVGGLRGKADAERVVRPLGIAAGVIGTGLTNLDLRLSLAEQATHDKLTGLHNRRHLDAILPLEFERAERRGVPLCVAMLDIDHFKRYNDDYGHEVGDAVLRALADHLREALRGTDGIFRYGGEEFLLILSEAGPGGALRRLDQLREGIAGLQIRIGERALPTPTVSIGVALSVPWSSDLDALIRSADQALYRAKQAGRNRVELAPAPSAPSV